MGDLLERLISSIITFFAAILVSIAVIINILMLTNNMLITMIIAPIISVPIIVIIGSISYYLLIKYLVI